MTAAASKAVLCAALLAGALAAQNSDLLQSVDQVLGRGDRAPTIDEILGDTVSRLRGVDALTARAAAGRLKETERELALYETLLRQVKSGLLVNVPGAGAPAGPVTEEAVALERKKVAELAAQLEAALADVRSSESRPKTAPAAPKPSRMSDAMLDVVVEVPRSPEGSRAGVAPAADPAGLSRALFQAGDYAGTLDALAQIPDHQMTAERRYCRARSLDQLGRHAEARAAYEAVVAADKDGAVGKQAAWMLKLAKTREQVATAIGNSDTAKKEQKK
jgi:hypothetical protein